MAHARHPTAGPAAAAGGLAAVLLAVPAAAEPVRVQGHNLALACTQPNPVTLVCDYRQFLPVELRGITASVGETRLPAGERESFPAAGDTSAVLFLVDTSDPGRKETVARNVEQVVALVRAAGPHHRLGLASFDSDLRLEAPLGASPGQLIAAARKLSAEGRTTELYRNAMQAVEHLGTYPATRRTLVMFSDGLAEDTAYFHRDVVSAARNHGVAIVGLGYARSVAQSVALQTLRRLSDETGGQFVAADENQALPPAFLARPYEVADNGGRIALDLRPAIRAGASGAFEARIAVATANGESAAVVPIDLPAPPAPARTTAMEPDAGPEPTRPSAPVKTPATAAAPGTATATAPATKASTPAATATAPATTASAPAAKATAPATTPAAPEATATTTAAAPTASATTATAPAAATVRSASPAAARPPLRRPLPPSRGGPGWLLYGGLGLGLLLALSLAGFLVWRRRRSRDPDAPEPPAEEPEVPTLGFLEIQDGTGARHRVESAAFRIGRSSDNELTLYDPSISRHHAEVHRRRDGTFTVTDLDSMNGIFVNERKVRSSALEDGDILEVGDVVMRFVTASFVDLAGEDTVMLSTAPPRVDLSDQGAA